MCTMHRNSIRGPIEIIKTGGRETVDYKLTESVCGFKSTSDILGQKASFICLGNYSKIYLLTSKQSLFTFIVYDEPQSWMTYQASHFISSLPLCCFTITSVASRNMVKCFCPLLWTSCQDSAKTPCLEASLYSLGMFTLDSKSPLPLKRSWILLFSFYCSFPISCGFIAWIYVYACLHVWMHIHMCAGI